MDEQKTKEENTVDVQQDVSGFIRKEDLQTVIQEIIAKGNERYEKLMHSGDESKAFEAQYDQTLVQWFTALNKFDFAGMANAVKQAVTLTTGVEATAGALVHPTFQKKVYAFMGENTVIYDGAQKVTLQNREGNTVNTQDLLSDVTVGWTPEGIAKHLTNPTFAQPTAILDKMTAIVRMTDEFRQDAFLDPIDYLAQRVGRQMRIALEDALVNGNSENIDGILAAVGTSSIPLGAGTTSADITYDDLLRLKIEYLRKNNDFGNGIAYISAEGYGEILLQKASGSGEFMVPNTNPSAVSPVGVTPGFLGQVPYKVSTALPENVTAASTPFAFYTDLAQHLLVIQKADMEVKISQDASLTDGETTINAFTQDETFVRFHRRVGAVAVNPSGIILLETPSES